MEEGGYSPPLEPPLNQSEAAAGVAAAARGLPDGPAAAAASAAKFEAIGFQKTESLRLGIDFWLIKLINKRKEL